VEFIRQRSKATADHFMGFVTSRNLDMDVDTWPDSDRDDFHNESRALIDEWKRKAWELGNHA